jgi:tRNA 2-thiouridine synthesizing protein A
LPDREPRARTIDTTGLACPLPVLKARKVLLAMAPGERLALVASDPLAAVDIPHFCREAGHRLVDSEGRGGLLYFTIERGIGDADVVP